MRYQPLATIKELFMQGLLTVLPLTLTVGLVSFSIRILRDSLAPIKALLPHALQAIPFAEFILVFLVILAIGLVSKWFLVNLIWNAFELVVGRIPLLRPIYFSIKQLVSAFSQDEGSFQKIALIEFPRSGMYSIGFITCPAEPPLAPPDKTYYSAFIPATPNPTTGFYIIVAQEDCTILDISKHEAMSLLMSGGIVQPESFSPSRKTS